MELFLVDSLEELDDRGLDAGEPPTTRFAARNCLRDARNPEGSTGGLSAAELLVFLRALCSLLLAERARRTSDFRCLKD